MIGRGGNRDKLGNAGPISRILVSITSQIQKLSAGTSPHFPSKTGNLGFYVNSPNFATLATN